MEVDCSQVVLKWDIYACWNATSLCVISILAHLEAAPIVAREHPAQSSIYCHLHRKHDTPALSLRSPHIKARRQQQSSIDAAVCGLPQSAIL